MKDIQVITGCMFAGKTTELINRLKAIKENYILVKPIIDNRDSGNLISTHSGMEEKAIRVNRLSDIFHQLDKIEVVGIDEAQFFKKSIIQDLDYLKSKNIEIIRISDIVIRLTATCNQCGSDATYSHRKNTDLKKQFLIGDENFYEALCKNCFNNVI